MIEVELPDGSVAEFPDGTPPDAIKGAIQKRFPPKQQSDQRTGTTASGLAKAYGTGVGEGVIGMAGMPGDAQTMGGRINAWIAGKLGATPEVQDTMLNMGMVTMSPGVGVTSAKMPTSADIKSGVEGVTGEFYKPQSVAEDYAQTLGQFTPGAFVGPGGAATKAGGLVGGALGSETAGQATKGTAAEPYARLAGGLVGGVAGGMVGAKAVTPSVAKAEVKDLEQMWAQKDAAYKAVDNAGIRYGDNAVNQMLQNIDDKWASMNFNPARHDKAMAFVPQLQKMYGSSPSLTELDQLRQVIYRDVVNGADDANAAFGRAAIDEIDNMIENATPQMMAQGDPRQAAALIQQAREANKAYKSSEAVFEKLDKAERQALKTGKGTNQDNAMRQKVDDLINQKGGKFYKMQPQSVQDAMQQVVRGTGSRNALRLAGALAPTGIVSGGIGASLGAGAGTFLGGPAGTVVGSFAVPAIGALAKKLADAKTQGEVMDLLRLMQANGDAAAAGLSTGPSLIGQAVPQGITGAYSGTIPSRARTLAKAMAQP